VKVVGECCLRDEWASGGIAALDGYLLEVAEDIAGDAVEAAVDGLCGGGLSVYIVGDEAGIIVDGVVEGRERGAAVVIADGGGGRDGDDAALTVEEVDKRRSRGCLTIPGNR